MSRWAVASGRCKPEVKKLALKGTGAARCRPPRSQAWLRSHMVSSNEVSFNLREKFPLSRNILHTCEVTAYGFTRQRTSLKATRTPIDYRDRLAINADQKVLAGYLDYPANVRDTAKSGMGYSDNRHLSDFVEFIFVNVGGLLAEVSSPPMKQASVGAAVVVRGWESQPHGEGPQSVGIPKQNSQMLTQRNLL
jgi:hypothetical protein